MCGLFCQPRTDGVSSLTRIQAVEGLAEGDSVALPSDTPLARGARVKPVWR